MKYMRWRQFSGTLRKPNICGQYCPYWMCLCISFCTCFVLEHILTNHGQFVDKMFSRNANWANNNLTQEIKPKLYNHYISRQHMRSSVWRPLMDVWYCNVCHWLSSRRCHIEWIVYAHTGSANDATSNSNAIKPKFAPPIPYLLDLKIFPTISCVTKKVEFSLCIWKETFCYAIIAST